MPDTTNKDTSIIPTGPYCYDFVDSKQVTCPYWSNDPTKHHQENGCCSFLGTNDWEINETRENVIIHSKGKPVPKEEQVPMTGHEIGIPIGLLWDMCKECGINEDYED